MTKKTAVAASLMLLLCGSAGRAQSQPVPVAHAEPAQKLVDSIVSRHPELLDILLHVTPPDQMRNLVIAAHLPNDLGEISGEDDLGVARTGKPLVEVQKDGVRIGVLLPLRDIRHRSIGAIGLMFPWHAGDKKDQFLKRAEHIRDEIAGHIRSKAGLFTAS